MSGVRGGAVPGTRWVVVVVVVASRSNARTLERSLSLATRASLVRQVLFGMDYSSNDVDAQHQLLQESLMDHLAVYPQSLIVIEEYDKLDCHMRGFFRQMLQGNQLASGNRTASLRDSIVVLESNMGQTVLHGLLESGASPAGPRRREDVPMADAVRGLKDMLFSRWREQGCEDFSDSQKFMRSIDHVLPFYPLEEADIVELFFKKLKGYEDASGGRVVCDDQCRDVVVPFLVDKVEFDGRFPLEGGKEVNTVSTGYLSRAFRRFLEEEADGATDERRGWRVDAERVAVLIEDRRVGVRRSSTSENGSQEGS